MSKDNKNKPRKLKPAVPEPVPEPVPELSETPVIDGEQANAPVEVPAELTPEIIVGNAAEQLKFARDAIKRNLIALDQVEDAIEACVHKQVGLPQDIQLSALCGISSGTVIKVDKQNLDCVLLGQAKGQLIRRDGEVVLVIHKRTRVVDKKET